MKLTPKIHPDVKSFLEDKERLFDLVGTYDVPLGIIFPSLIHDNISGFNDVFNKYGIKGKIYFAHKCNKSDAIVKTIKSEGINIDVASLNELKHALNCGFTGKEIEATGPKNDKFIILGLQHDILFNCDNLEEVETIIKYHNLMGKKIKTNILVRLNNFCSCETKIINKQSRFGISKDQIDIIIKLIKENENLIELKGFSFHLDTVSEREKVIAIENLIEIISYCYSFNLNPNTISMGGGFKVNYIESENIWNQYISELKNNIMNNSNDIWNNTNFGIKNENGILKGVLTIAEYFNKFSKQDTLDSILSTKSSKFQNQSISDILKENMISLIIEPGKSLLDNVGITITNITYTKYSVNNDLLIGTNMNKSNLMSENKEMFMDPILISQNIDNKTNKAFVLGNLCLESDLIFKRKIEFDNTPRKDDLLIFINTAAYSMDFNESQTIMQNISKKIVFSNNKIYLDNTYEPILQGIKYENQ